MLAPKKNVIDARNKRIKAKIKMSGTPL